MKLDGVNRFGGVYLWESMAALQAYRQSDLAATIAEAYKVVGTPEVEILETLFELRD